MDSITTLIVEDEPMLAEILVDNIKQFPSSTSLVLRISLRAPGNSSDCINRS